MRYSKIFLSILLIFTVLFVSCAPAKERGSNNVNNASGSLPSHTTTSTGGIIVAKPGKERDIMAYLRMKKSEDGRYVFEFYIRNNRDTTYEYTSNNGCVVDWKVFKKEKGSWSLVYPTKPPICTQQIVVINVSPGQEKKISSFVMPDLGSGTFLVQGAMGSMAAQQIVEVK